MTLDELITQNGGIRPDRHWECVKWLGGCGEHWLNKPSDHLGCGPVAMVQLCDNTPIKFRKNKED